MMSHYQDRDNYITWCYYYKYWSTYVCVYAHKKIDCSSYSCDSALAICGNLSQEGNYLIKRDWGSERKRQVSREWCKDTTWRVDKEVEG